MVMAPPLRSAASFTSFLKNNGFWLLLLIILLWSIQTTCSCNSSSISTVSAAASNHERIEEEDEDEDNPVVRVTKQISFSDFNSSRNPRIEQELKFLGSAKLASSSIQIPAAADTNNGIAHRSGRAIFTFPIRVFDPHTNTTASFSTWFTFQLTSSTTTTTLNGSSKEAQAHGGSGLTFLMSPDEFTVGRPGPWLAMLNDACENVTSKFFAVEFDTRWNPEFGDPNDNHVGINLGSVLSTVTVNASDFNISFHDGSVHQVLVSYDGPARRILIQIGSGSDLKTVYSSDHLDLSPFLREYMFVGFSASTGRFPQIHRILSWNFTATSTAVLRVPRSDSCEGRILQNQKEKEGGVDDGKQRQSTLFFIFLAVGVLCFAVLINLYFYTKRRRITSLLKNDAPPVAGLPDRADLMRPQPPNRPRRFTLSTVSSATKGFSDSEILTVDEYGGPIYKGVLPNGAQVAVKRFSPEYLLVNSSSSKRQFLKRARSLSRVAKQHQNLVAIRGWCYDRKKEFALVYEYVFNGCLDKWLFGVGVLPWTRRIEVLRNVASGLSHLHAYRHAHGNVRVNSVFLDVSFTALLGDYGLGADLDLEGFDSKVINRAAGDVFDFGVFILEVVAGRRRRGRRSESDSTSGLNEEMDLLDWAWVLHEDGEKIEAVDKRVLSGVDPEIAVRVVEIGLLCTLGETHGRPKMEEVVTFLNVDDGPIPDLPSTRPIVLCPYNSAPSLCGSYVCAPF